MKKVLAVVLALVLWSAACSSKPTPMHTPTAIIDPLPSTVEEETPLPTATPTPTPTPIIVDTTEDSGEGSFRWALEQVRFGGAIQFDATVFPVIPPSVIYVQEELNHLTVGNVNIDAVNAGVILDGSQIDEEWVAGLQIVGSSNNRIRGLVIREFPGPGITLSGDSAGNLITRNQLVKNVVGIDMADSGSVGNTITRNVIGTDSTGWQDLGNERVGIMVGEGSYDNVIGPGNHIAYHNEQGIYIEPSMITANTVFDNNLYANRVFSTVIREDERTLQPPVILDFNFNTGEVKGSSCPECAVRVFSTETGEERQPEAVAVADANGNFAINQGGPFKGSAIVVQAVAPDGTGSDFSWPLVEKKPQTVGSEITSSYAEGSYTLVLQEGNQAPRIQLVQQPSINLRENHIATQFDAFGYPEEFYDLSIYPSGVTRARISISGLEPDLVNWDASEFEIHPSHDAAIERMMDNGVILTYVLMFWDKETYPNGEGAPCYRFKTEEEIERWLDYVRFIVGHFKGKLQYYEIWNEPDIPDFCPKSIEVDDYIHLVEQTIPVIRETDPNAEIIIGAVSNTRFGGGEYLFDLLVHGGEILPFVDVISWHPHYGTSAEYEVYEDYVTDYPWKVKKIKDMAEANGFTGEYHVDELTWRTKDNFLADQPWTYSQISANKYFLRSAIWHLGNGINIGLGAPYFVTPILSTVMDGAGPGSLGYMTETEYQRGVSFHSKDFILADGSILLAVWNQGDEDLPLSSIVKEYDEGVEGKLYIEGVEPQRVTVIDLLYGVEQEVAFYYDDFYAVEDALIIEDLIVKDYPVLIKLWMD